LELKAAETANRRSKRNSVSGSEQMQKCQIVVRFGRKCPKGSKRGIDLEQKRKQQKFDDMEMLLQINFLFVKEFTSKKIFKSLSEKKISVYSMENV
jgi:cobalamin biosynthesis Co2+ chelatase CbiK